MNDKTFDEIVDILGEKLKNLTFFKGEWVTNYRQFKDGNFKYDSCGKTPREAVSNLLKGLIFLRIVKLARTGN